MVGYVDRRFLSAGSRFKKSRRGGGIDRHIVSLITGRNNYLGCFFAKPICISSYERLSRSVNSFASSQI